MRIFLDREALFFYLWSNSWKFVKVVYMDEPSTGLDPASRNNLWNVVKRAKQDRAIILTSKKHSLSLSLSLSV
jgi:energy-coupling factor transporter ATP-binding protein EcfA2